MGDVSDDWLLSRIMKICCVLSGSYIIGGMQSPSSLKPVLRWKRKAVKVIDGRLVFVPLKVSIMKTGKLLTTSQVSKLLQIPPDRVIRWIRQAKVLSAVQLSILERQERPDGFIKRDGSIRATDKQRFKEEQARIFEEHIQSGCILSINDIYEKAIAKCLQKYTGWTRKYIEEITLNIREDNPSIRKKAPRLNMRMRAQAQRRAHLYP